MQSYNRAGGGAAVPSWWGAWKVGGVPVLFLGIHGNRAGGVLLFLHGGAWKVGGVPVLFLGIHGTGRRGAAVPFMVGRGRWATDHPRSSNVSRPIFRSLCPHTKCSFSFLFVSSGEKRFKMYHFDRCKSPRTPLFKGV